MGENNTYFESNDKYDIYYTIDSSGDILVESIFVNDVDKYENQAEYYNIIKTAFTELSTQHGAMLAYRCKKDDVESFERIGCYYISHKETDNFFVMYFDAVSCEQVALKNTLVQTVLKNPNMQREAIDVINAIEKRKKEKEMLNNENSNNK